jgi:GAF domain-containing protein
MTSPGRDSDGEKGLAAVTEELATARSDAHEILAGVTATLGRLRPGLWIAVLMDKDPTTARVVVADGADPLLADYVNRYVATAYQPGRAPNTGLTKRVIESGRPVLITDLPFSDFMPMMSSAAQSYLRTNLLPYNLEQPSVSALIVPMRARGATIGTLGVFGVNSSPSFTDQDIGWVQDVADRAALAIENAQSQAVAITRFERLNTLQIIAHAITGGQDLRLTLKLLLEHLTTRLPVDAADVLLVDPGDHEFFVAVSSGFHSTSMPDYRFPARLEGSNRLRFAGEIATMAELDSLEQSRRRSLFAREGFRAYRGAPLIVRNRVRGRLEVFHRSDFEPDQEQLAFIELMATMAAMAIDAEAMLDRLRARAALEPEPRVRQPAPELTKIECEVMKRLVEGKTNAAIASSVHRAENTVRFYVRRLLRKTGATNRTELARRATQEGWV